MPGHHITVPRDETPMRNNAAQAQLNDDINSNIGSIPGQTNTGYQSMLPVDYFNQNHIMPGSHITVPRDEAPTRNNANQLQYRDDINSNIGTLPGQTNTGY